MVKVTVSIGDCVFFFRLSTGSLIPLEVNTTRGCNRLPPEAEISMMDLEAAAEKINDNLWEALRKEMSEEQLEDAAERLGMSLEGLRNYYTAENVHSAIETYRSFGGDDVSLWK